MYAQSAVNSSTTNEHIVVLEYKLYNEAVQQMKDSSQNNTSGAMIHLQWLYPLLLQQSSWSKHPR